MPEQLFEGYLPQYPQQNNLPDPEIRAFITNFYQTSDKQELNELWVSRFTKDAEVIVGRDGGTGEKEIRELRSRMWSAVRHRQHTVTKVFPGQFQDPGDTDAPAECELMLFGEVKLVMRDGEAADGAPKVVSWAGRGVLRKEKGDGQKGEWKFAKYRVWL